MATKRQTLKEFQLGRGYTKEDWDAVDSPPLTDEELARMRPAREVLPPEFFEAIEEMRRARGRPKMDAPKVAVTLRLEPEVLEKFKARGKDWRSAMAEELKKASRR
ncbi:BrnA antitoxin family protein [Rhizobium sp. LCM 4573]|uniref:BrnA antitoxin family protein n=1 Tax=Rhizobium sp. LCM 4573 TaxID=1848291 RepID=UPI0008DAEF88|nr:BrnA antitoxin family protein [Rhizobium sp. LCM 4573]OHV75921.1 hypothetical protein LCM4573_14785 [Rhizobium sp. LCM 4573]